MIILSFASFSNIITEQEGVFQYNHKRRGVFQYNHQITDCIIQTYHRLSRVEKRKPRTNMRLYCPFDDGRMTCEQQFNHILTAVKL